MMKPTKLIFGVLFLVFFIRGWLFLDPDFGWHLRNGELILSQGLFRVDPYSYTMPTFSVVSHEWLIDALWHIQYSGLGKLAITITWALLPVFLLIFLTKGYSRGRLLVTILAAGVIFPFYGNRPQVLGWILLAIVGHILLYAKDKSSKKIFPLIFILWSNLHGSFAAGIALLWIVLVVKFSRHTVTKGELILGVISTAATLVNPFGLRIWSEIWSSVSDPQLRWRIGEWGPAIFSFQPLFLLYIVLFGTLILRYRKKLSTESLAVAGFFFVQAMGSVRHVPLFLVATVPLLLRSFSIFEKEVTHPEGKKRLQNALNGLLAIIIILCSGFGIFVMQETITEGYYPMGGITFIKQNLPQNNIFSHYNWGGYMIWKLPEKKVFIDGRMPSWREGGVPSAMDEYLAIIGGNYHFKVAFAKYDIDTVLWPKNTAKSAFSSFINSISKPFLGFTFQEYNFLTDLERNKWEKVYEDDVSVIYIAP